MRDGNLVSNVNGWPNKIPFLRDNIQRVSVLYRSHGEHALTHAVEHLAVLRLIAPEDGIKRVFITRRDREFKQTDVS